MDVFLVFFFFPLLCNIKPPLGRLRELIERGYMVRFGQKEICILVRLGSGPREELNVFDMEVRPGELAAAVSGISLLFSYSFHVTFAFRLSSLLHFCYFFYIDVYPSLVYIFNLYLF